MRLDQVLSNHRGTWRTALPEVPGSRWLTGTSVSVARLLVAKMAAEHPEPPKGELQLPPPPPPGHYGAWAAQELQAKLAEIGAPIQGEALGLEVKRWLRGLVEKWSLVTQETHGPGAETGCWALVCRVDADPPDSVLHPLGSREELVERLQTYTRQVSVVAGVQDRLTLPGGL